VTWTADPDTDKDDDGILDTDEINTYETDPCDVDSDDDFIQDGTELGFTSGDPTYTDTGVFIPDADGGATTTNPLDDDTDDDGLKDGEEDTNYNGMYEPGLGETDPNPMASIPTLNEWGMMIFILLLITAGMIVIRRRQEQ